MWLMSEITYRKSKKVNEAGWNRKKKYPHFIIKNFPRWMSLSQRRCTTALSSVHFWAKIDSQNAAGSSVTESSPCTGEGRMEGISTMRIQTAK